MLTGVESLLPAGTRLSRYQIIEQIGKGGMGVVYLAKDLSLHRKVAIKVLPASLSENADRLSRFEQEAVAASALNHPNILTIHEIGESGGTHFMVSEFVKGQTLSERIGTLSMSESVDVASQIAAALEAAHHSGIIHRDIKPENIMIRDDGIVKVLDFGLAKLAENRVSIADTEADTRAQVNTRPGTLLGTVHYMSPEQARGQDVDSGTDIWSLGVVLFEMIAGSLPFEGESDFDYIAAILKSEPAALKTAVPQVPNSLNDIVARAIEKDRSKRYRTSSELLRDLATLRRGRTTQPQAAHASDTGRGNDARSSPTDVLSTGGKRPASHDFGFKKGIAAGAILLLLVLAAASYRMYSGSWLPALSAPASKPEIKSLAVLPLKSLDADENYLGFGIADAVIRRISQTGQLTVRPTSAVRRYLTEDTDALTAAKQLTSDAVLEGTVQRVGDRLRVTVNLLRTGDGASLWAESFDTQVTDIFAVQDKVAQQVAARLQLQLDPSQQERLAKRTTSNPVAYEYYVKGVYSFNQRRFDDTAREQIDSTIDLLRKAIDNDPNYALAHAKLAHAYAWKGLFIEIDDQPRLLALANEEIEKADAIDPQLAETHISRFRIMFSEPGGWRIEEAVKELLMAQQIDPNVGHEELADMYLHIGLEDLMDREIRRALEIDPTSEWIKLQMLVFYLVLNRYDDYLKVKNEHFPEVPVQAGYFLVKGDLAKAKELLDEEAKKDPRGADPTLKSMLFAMEGRKRESEALVPAILKEAKRMSPAYHHVAYDVACIYAMNGNVPEAMKWLREAAATGNPQYTQFNRDPFLDKIRQTPEFIQFMTELKPQYDKYRSEFH